MAWPTKTDFADGDVLTAAQVNNIGTNLNLANPTGITDGYVLTANGANSMGWEALPPPASYTLLTSGTVTNQAEVLLTNISDAYTDLELFVMNPSPHGSGTALYIDCYTGATAAAGSYRMMSTIFASTYTQVNNTGADARLRLWTTPTLSAANSTGNLFRSRFYGYSSTETTKYADGTCINLDGSGVPRGGVTASSVTQTTGAALNRIRIFILSGNISCRYLLFGIK